MPEIFFRTKGGREIGVMFDSEPTAEQMRAVQAQLDSEEGGSAERPGKSQSLAAPTSLGGIAGKAAASYAAKGSPAASAGALVGNLAAATQTKRQGPAPAKSPPIWPPPARTDPTKNANAQTQKEPSLQSVITDTFEKLRQNAQFEALVKKAEKEVPRTYGGSAVASRVADAPSAAVVTFTRSANQAAKRLAQVEAEIRSSGMSPARLAKAEALKRQINKYSERIQHAYEAIGQREEAAELAQMSPADWVLSVLEPVTTLGSVLTGQTPKQFKKYTSPGGRLATGIADILAYGGMAGAMGKGLSIGAKAALGARLAPSATSLAIGAGLAPMVAQVGVEGPAALNTVAPFSDPSADWGDKTLSIINTILLAFGAYYGGKAVYTGTKATLPALMRKTGVDIPAIMRKAGVDRATANRIWAKADDLLKNREVELPQGRGGPLGEIPSTSRSSGTGSTVSHVLDNEISDGAITQTGIGLLEDALREDPVGTPAIINALDGRQEIKDWLARKALDRSSPGGGRSIAPQNALTGALRGEVDLPGYLDVEPQTMKQWAADAREKGYSSPEGASALADAVLGGSRLGESGKATRVGAGKVSLDPSESLGVAARAIAAGDEYAVLSARLKEVIGTNDETPIVSQMDTLRNEIDRLTNALNKAGTASARELAVRRGLVDKDLSFEGLYATERKLRDRPLTKAETDRLQDEAAELAAVSKQEEALKQDGATAELERELWRVSRKRASGKRASGKRVAQLRAERKEIVSRLVKNLGAPSSEARMTLFGADVAMERMAKIAPDVLDLLKNIAKEGKTRLSTALPAAKKALAEHGIEISDDELKGILTGTIREKVAAAERELTNYQRLKQEAWAELQEKAAENRRKLAQAKQAARDAQRAEARRLRAEAEAAEKERKAAERAFLKEVRERQREFEKGRAKDRSKEREEYRRWWAGVGSARPGLLDAIERASEKLRIMAEDGIIPGELTRLKNPALRELELRRARILNEIEKRRSLIIAARDGSGILESIGRAIGTPVGLKTMADVSAPLTLGGWAALTNTGAWTSAWKSFVPAMTKKGFADLTADLRADGAMYDKVVRTGVDLPAFGATMGEEYMLRTSLDAAPVIGPVKGWSEREYAGFMTLLRYNMAKEMISLFEKDGLPLSDEMLKWIGRSVNTWTGRGKWTRGLDRTVGTAMFAPSYFSSLFETALNRPMWDAIGVWQRTGNSRPFTYAATKYMRGLAMTAGIMYVSGAEMNPYNDDFGKVVVKNDDGSSRSYDVIPTHIQQPLRFLFQFFGQRAVTRDGDEKEGYEAIKSTLTRTLMSRRTPALAGAQDLVVGESFGKSLDLTTAGGWLNFGLLLAAPISATQVKDIVESPQFSTSDKWAAVLLALTGRGAQLRESLPNESLSDIEWVKKYAGMHGLSGGAQYKKMRALIAAGDKESAKEYAKALREAWLDARPVGKAEQAKRDER